MNNRESNSDISTVDAKYTVGSMDRTDDLGNRTPTRPGSSMAGKRVAMVVLSSYPFDPRPRRAAETLSKEGMQVELICQGDKDAPKREIHNGIDVRRVAVKHKRGGKVAYIYEYLAFIVAATFILGWRSLSRKYHVVYVHNMPNALVICGLIPKLFGASVILDVHDPMPELMVTIFGLKEDSLSVRLTKIEEKLSMKLVDRVITVNETCRRIFSLRSCPEEKINVVMNSPDGSIFPSRTPNSYASNRQMPAPFVIMYHGSLLERNGLDLAAEALPCVLQAVPNAELWIYGKKTPFLENVLEKVKQLGVSHAVKYLGPKLLEDLVPAIEGCDVGVIPNHKNMFTEINTPTRIFEYLALGKPVIAPRTPGIQDYFTDDTLFFFNSGDAQDLAERIIAVASDRQRALNVAERAQQVYFRHTWEQERKELIGAVANVLREGA